MSPTVDTVLLLVAWAWRSRQCRRRSPRINLPKGGGGGRGGGGFKTGGGF